MSHNDSQDTKFYPKDKPPSAGCSNVFNNAAKLPFSSPMVFHSKLDKEIVDQFPLLLYKAGGYIDEGIIYFGF